MPNPLGKSHPLKTAGPLIILVLFYFLIPASLSVIIPGSQLKYNIIFYLLNAVIFYYLFRKYATLSYAVSSRVQNLNEKTNLLNAEISVKKQNNSALKENSQRISSLKDILEKIAQTLELDIVAEVLACDAFSLVAHNKGNCLLYLVDGYAQKLTLFKVKKEDLSMVIKSKEGNIFDHWVLKHATPLLIENIRNDFRFDLERFKFDEGQLISSLVSAPLVSENKFLGIIRLDNPAPGFFTQDDLRFLVAISDLGAVAIENSELFKKTQDLAIHDALTNFYSKGYFLERLRDECNRSLRLDTPLVLFMLDIDLFKNYNDEFGHMAGDIVLKKVSQLIVNSLANFRPLISRFGGEEFCVVIAGVNKESALDIAEGLRASIEKEKILLRRVETHVTVSIGVAEFSSTIADGDELIRSADKAMYLAKQKGRNRVCTI